MAHWALDDGKGTIASDSTGNVHDGTLNGGSVWVEGYIGGALSLDGSNGNVRVPHSAALNPSIFSVSLWVNVASESGGYRAAISSRNDFPQSGYVVVATSANVWEFWTGTGSGWHRMTGPSLIPDKWVHLAAVVGDTKQLYVDGELAVEASGTFLANSNQDLTIGAMLDTLFGEELNFFAGLIDDVHVYDHALTPDEISALYEPENAGPAEEEIVELVTAGDLTGDYYVDKRDLAAAALAWLQEDCGLSKACEGADVYPPGGDGTVNFKDLAIIVAACGHCLDPTNSDCTHMPLTLYEPPRTTSLGMNVEKVQLFSGEFYKSVVDLRIPGRGIDFIWARTYRSRTGRHTSMGNGWSHSYDIWLQASSDRIILHDGTGRRDIYYPQPSGTWAADGFFRELAQNDDKSFTMTFADKSRWEFHPFGVEAGPGKIFAMTDRNGNSLRFRYDHLSRLTTIHDTLGTAEHNRDIIIAYNEEGSIETVTDFAGRTVSYEYYGIGEPNGSAGDLKSVTSPAVTGTPNENDFPDGKRTVYTYSRGYADERLNHNLLTITDPKGQTYTANAYGTNPDDPSFDRVERRRLGGPDDVINYTYYRQLPEPDNSYAVSRTVTNDRMGNEAEYFFSNRNELLILRQHTGRADQDESMGPNPKANPPLNKLRDSDPDYFETRYQYNSDHLLRRIDYPNGNYITNVYEGDLDPNTPVRSGGNLRERRHFSGTLADVSDQDVIVDQFEYDNELNRGTNLPTRHVNGRGYETLFGYDSKGNRISRTKVIPGPDSNIVEEQERDEIGRVTASIWPDNGSDHRRRDEYTYYTEPNDSNYGFLRSVIVDSEHLALTTTYEYDYLGNVVRVIYPNGKDTKRVVNQLNQAVQQISPEVSGDVRHKRDLYYDRNNNLVRVDVENYDVDKDGESVLQPNTHYTTTNDYDILNKVVRKTKEVDSDDGNSVVTEYEYDRNRDLTLVRYGEATNDNEPGNVVRTLYDERRLVFQVIRGEGDPCQSTTQYDYDRNGNLKKVTQGLEGTPRITTSDFDGFNRLIASYDAMGNVSKYRYDAAGNLTSTLIQGELQDNIGGYENIPLYKSSYEYDALDRLTRSVVDFFDPHTQPIGDGASTAMFSYNDGRQLMQIVDDGGNATRYEYDTAGRPKIRTDAKGNRTIYTYDENSNVAVTEVHISDLGEPDETFVTSFEYDGLGRLISITDNIGNTTGYAYNSQSKCTLVTDALNNKTRREFDGLGRLVRTIRYISGNGDDPDPDDIVTRRAYDDNSRLLAHTDDNGNTTRYEYDAFGRNTRVIYADGTEKTVSYDVHNNPVRRTDGNGSIITNTYDLLNRLTDKSITPGPEVMNTTTFENFRYDGLSRVTGIVDDNAEVSLKYDSLSNVVEERLNDQVTTSTFDAMRNKLSVEYPGGRTINNVYDELNRIREVSEGATTVASYHYVGPRRIRRRSYGNNTQCDYTYDDAKRLSSTTHIFDPEGAETVIDQRTYAWDPAYNKTQQMDLRADGPQLTRDYSYDAARRLVHTTVTDPFTSVVRDTHYQLDGVGNRELVTGSPDPGPWVGSYTMESTFPEPADYQMNQYTYTPSDSDSRKYDRNGNLLSTLFDDGSPDYTYRRYDYRNRMVEYVDGTTGRRHTYKYDPLGRRISKVVGAEEKKAGELKETRYFYDNGRVIEERDDNEVTHATYAYDGGILGFPDVPYDVQGSGSGHDDGIWLVDPVVDDVWWIPSWGDSLYYMRAQDSFLSAYVEASNQGNRVVDTADISLSNKGTLTDDSGFIVDIMVQWHRSDSWDRTNRTFSPNAGVLTDDSEAIMDVTADWVSNGNWKAINGAATSDARPMNGHAREFNNRDLPANVSPRFANSMGIGRDSLLSAQHMSGTIVLRWDVPPNSIDTEITSLFMMRSRDSFLLAGLRQTTRGPTVPPPYMSRAQGSDSGEDSEFEGVAIPSIFDGPHEEVPTQTLPSLPSLPMKWMRDLSSLLAYDMRSTGSGDDNIMTRREGVDYYYHGDGSANVMAVTDGNGLTVERYSYSDDGQPYFFDGSGSKIDESAIGNTSLFGLKHDPETGLLNSGSRYLDPVTGRSTTRE